MTEADLKQIVAEYPDSPMGHFSLGKHYLGAQQWAQAAACLAEAVRLDADYAAAWVALGDAEVGAGAKEKARDAWNRALATPHGKRDASLRMDLDERLAALDSDF